VEALGLVAAVFDPKASIRSEPEPLWASSMQRFRQLISVLPDVEIINYSPGELARLCGCSLRHFNHLFRNHFGASVRDRQAELRLLKSCQCLRNTDSEVFVVAQDCGFQSVEKFNFLFKKRFRVAPSEWRQREQAAADYETRISNPLESAQLTPGENRAIRVLHRH
jgi:transcriptional regulator GlxA family with amidase domain